MKNIIIILLAVSMLSSCAMFAPTGRAVIEASYVDAALRSGIPEQKIKTASLSNNEIQIVTHAFNKYNSFREKYREYVDNPIEGLRNINYELESDFAEVRKYYFVMYDLVDRHWEEYSPGDQAYLKNMEEHLVSLDESINDLVAKKQYLEAANKALYYVATIATIAAGISPK